MSYCHVGISAVRIRGFLRVVACILCFSRYMETNIVARKALVVVWKRGDHLRSNLLNVGIDDGRCAIDVTVDPDGPQHDISDGVQISNAASAILRTCVNTLTSNTGGVVKKLGTF